VEHVTYLPTLINALIVAGIGVLITFVTRTQIAEIKEEVRDQRSETRDLRSEMRTEFRDVRAEIAALRSDLTQVALAVGAKPQAG
jgi:predicted nuclease with TOPRIM domain